MSTFLIAYLVVGAIVTCYIIGFSIQVAKATGGKLSRAQIITILVAPVFWLPLIAMAIGQEVAKNRNK